ncbi:helix-turn-helix domain-containing protein [Xanthomonas theicola]|uniref:helix-turn-helix domain-containing protein n=1 Tax=Xanthomonas theicola TaxID=56464 RepID=UPI000FF88694|nr:transposase family protein [Xanthomonas theicola]
MGGGPRSERLDWLDRHAGPTRRLADNVARLCTATSTVQAARWVGLAWTHCWQPTAPCWRSTCSRTTSSSDGAAAARRGRARSGRAGNLVSCAAAWSH